jgi:hypothetical protein
MKYHNAAVILPLLVAMAAGCTTMGIGTGSTPSGANAATFNWKSSDGVSGTINATLSGGKTYSGQYFQITKDTTVDSIGPLWAGWGGWGGRGGRGWGYWGWTRRRTSSRTTQDVSSRISRNQAARICDASSNSYIRPTV